MVIIKQGEDMGKKKKKLNMGIMITKYVGLSIVALVGIGLLIFGISKTSGAELELEKALVACDDKDYSSYVEKTTNSTPGNDEINNQIDRYKRAMDRAMEANDYESYGKLNEEYQRLLALQSQTSTTSTSYDYTEADKAKERCRTLAAKQKIADENTSKILMGVGAALSIILILLIILFAVLDYKKYA